MQKLPKYILHKIYNRIPYTELQNIKGINKETKHYVEYEHKQLRNLINIIANIPIYRLYDNIKKKMSILVEQGYFSKEELEVNILNVFRFLEQVILSILEHNDPYFSDFGMIVNISILDELLSFYDNLYLISDLTFNNNDFEKNIKYYIYQVFVALLDAGFDVNLNRYKNKPLAPPFTTLISLQNIDSEEKYKFFEQLILHGLVLNQTHFELIDRFKRMENNELIIQAIKSKK
jgi:hypothetical protein